jgi:hypothetical protein
VQIVIAGTGPIHYLILIGHIDILPALSHKSSCHRLFAMNWVTRPFR